MFRSVINKRCRFQESRRSSAEPGECWPTEVGAMIVRARQSELGWTSTPNRSGHPGWRSRGEDVPDRQNKGKKPPRRLFSDAPVVDGDARRPWTTQFHIASDNYRVIGRGRGSEAAAIAATPPPHLIDAARMWTRPAGASMISSCSTDGCSVLISTARRPNSLALALALPVYPN